MTIDTWLLGSKAATAVGGGLASPRFWHDLKVSIFLSSGIPKIDRMVGFGTFVSGVHNIVLNENFT